MGGNPNIPGGEHHPRLVMGRNINIEERHGRVVVAYGTSTTKDETRGQLDLIISGNAVQEHRLAKPTRFDLATVNRLDLPWSEEWFSTPRSQPAIVISQLNDAAMNRLKEILAWRKANNRTD